MKTLFAIPLFLVMLVLISEASDWNEASLPPYSHSNEFVAIGSDGRLYAVKSNRNGYVFTSLQKEYRFQPSGDGFTGQILGRSKVFYFGKSCDAAGDSLKGTWSVNSTGLAFAMETAAGNRFSFNLLSSGLTPSHTC